MPTEYITAACQHLTSAGLTLRRVEHDLVEVASPGGYTSTCVGEAAVLGSLYAMSAGSHPILSSFHRNACCSM